MHTSFPRRFLAYLKERYDPLQFGVFYGMLAFAVAALVRDYFGVVMTARLAAHTVLLAAMLFAFYFILRVFDEHKDAAADRAAFPERVLSQGLVTLGHLRAAAAVCAMFVLGASLVFGPAMLAATLVVLGYAVLMLKEFFVGRWLRRHVFVYAVSHNAVVFLTILWCFVGLALAAFGRVASTPLPYRLPEIVLAALGLNVLVFSLEVARKIRMPDDERDGVDTYSKAVGYRRAAYLVVVVQAAGVALLAVSGAGLGVAGWVVVGLAFGGLVAAIRRFLRRPTAPRAARLLQPASFAFLAYLAALIVTA